MYGVHSLTTKAWGRAPLLIRPQEPCGADRLSARNNMGGPGSGRWYRWQGSKTTVEAWTDRRPRLEPVGSAAIVGVHLELAHPRRGASGLVPGAGVAWAAGHPDLSRPPGGWGVAGRGGAHCPDLDPLRLWRPAPVVHLPWCREQARVWAARCHPLRGWTLFPLSALLRSDL
jgi:hypothetical protein